jgi:hypothetical protein
MITDAGVTNAQPMADCDLASALPRERAEAGGAPRPRTVASAGTSAT